MVPERTLVHPPVPRWRRWLWLTGYSVFVVCFAAGGLLSVSKSGQPLLPGAIILWAPAGLVLIAMAMAALAGSDVVKGWRRGLGLLTAGLALFGAGMARLTGVTAFHVLTIPAIIGIGVYLLYQLLRRPSRSTMFSDIRRRRGAVRMWTAYFGSWLIMLVTPVGVAWALGVITVR